MEKKRKLITEGSMKYTSEEIKNKVNSVYDEAVSLRRHLHMYPELSEQEYETSRFICEQLDKMGIPYEKSLHEVPKLRK